jgi:hypothetical protein
MASALYLDSEILAMILECYDALFLKKTMNVDLINSLVVLGKKSRQFRLEMIQKPRFLIQLAQCTWC